MIDIFDLRKDFTFRTLNEKDISANPFEQFELWFKEAMELQIADANQMNLATVGNDMQPSSRTVLLKQVKSSGFVFFTNYESRKAKQLGENPRCSLCFLWDQLERQVRIEGIAEKVSEEESDSYFEVRPEGSKLGAWVSPQSQIVPNREYLEDLTNKFNKKFKGSKITRPDNWGGYIVKPQTIEFWQGRKNRLHDRILYSLDNGIWQISRLAP